MLCFFCVGFFVVPLVALIATVEAALYDPAQPPSAAPMLAMFGALAVSVAAALLLMMGIIGLGATAESNAPVNNHSPPASPRNSAPAEQRQEDEPIEIDEPSNSEPSNSEPTITRPTSKVTYENFMRVRNGMTLDEVYEILGKNCEVMSDVELGGFRTVLLMWKAGGLSVGNCNVTFQNGRVAAKAQAFLPHGPSEQEPAPDAADLADAPEAASDKGATDAASDTDPIPPVERPMRIEREFRTWRSGKYTTEAQFFSMTAGKVKLKKRDGTVVEVPLDKFSEEDQEYIRSGAYKRGE